MFRKKNKLLSKEQYLKKMLSLGIDENGYAIMDSEPMAPPIGYVKQPSMFELVRDMVQSERLRHEALAAGFESLEEADDFDIGDDAAEELYSGYENDLDVPIKELLEAGRQAIEERKAAEKAADSPDEPSDGADETDADPPSDGR